MGAVRGCFADFKTVKTRGVCQLIIEVPIESADHALAVLGGVPQAKAEQWVGIAPVTAPDGRTAEDKMIDRMVQKYAPELRVESGDEQTELERPKGGARAKRAGILCGDAAFQDFLCAKWPGHWKVYNSRYGVSVADIAACVVRRLCGCKESRAELDHNEAAGRIFDGIVDEYYASQRGETPELIERQANR